MATNAASIQHKGAKMVNHNPQTNLLRTTVPLTEVENLLSFLISIYRGQRDKPPWTVFKITPKEIETVWSTLQKEESLYGFVLDKIRLVNKSGRVWRRYSTNILEFYE